MSKKTRKKSKAASPAKGLRAGLKKTTQKPVSATRQRPASKSTKATVKTAAKTPAKKAAKAATKSAAKKDAKAPAKATMKTPPVKAPAAKVPAAKAAAVNAPPEAARKATSAKPRAKKPAAETMVETVAAPAATIIPAAAAIPAALEPLAPAATEPAAAPAAPAHEAVATEGGPAPGFDLPRDGGERVSLADHIGQKLVIFFYPRADTPGCTREAIDFTRLNSDFAAAGTAVLGVSADPLRTQESFRNKHQLSVPLVSDETHQMLQAYGAWGEKSMYGRTFQGVLRTTVLIDGGGRIAKIWRGVKVDGHADAVLAAAREL